MTNNNNLIFIIAQQFYGNRTGIEIRRDEIDRFLLGMPSFKDETKIVDRRIVKIPNSNNLVIIYDHNQESKYVNIQFPRLYAEMGAEYKEQYGTELKMHVSCEIPEINFKIHTRCFACRLDKNGEFQSLENGDTEKFIHYFA